MYRTPCHIKPMNAPIKTQFASEKAANATKRHRIIPPLARVCAQNIVAFGNDKVEKHTIHPLFRVEHLGSKLQSIGRKPIV